MRFVVTFGEKKKREIVKIDNYRARQTYYGALNIWSRKDAKYAKDGEETVVSLFRSVIASLCAYSVGASFGIMNLLFVLIPAAMDKIL